MNNNRKLNHTTYDCKYHMVWISKYRGKRYMASLENISVKFLEHTMSKCSIWVFLGAIKHLGEILHRVRLNKRH